MIIMPHIIYAPDPTFTGVCSGIEFVDGVGFCNSDFIAGWLCAKGFTINPENSGDYEKPALPPIPDSLNNLSCDELVALARAYSVPMTGIRHGDKVAIVKAITEAVNSDG